MTLWITGGAAAVSLGFGTAFAHAIPGHSASTQGARGTSSAGASPASAGQAQSQQSQQSQLTQPAQQPAQTTAPPVVTSGGS